MERSHPPARHPAGLTLFEALMLVLVLSVLLAILFPFPYYGRGEKARQSQCANQIRQLAVVAQMYSEDHGRYPDGDWVKQLSAYLGEDALKIFKCPSDAGRAKQPVSYAYSGLLIGLDGKGVKPELVRSPSEVGVVCDASPATQYPHGAILDIGAEPRKTGSAISARHHGFVIIVYADGHVKLNGGSPSETDLGSGVQRAFRQVSPMGLVDNPAGGLPDFSPINTCTDPVAVGGEYCTRSILLAAARAWEVKAKASVQVLPFTGQYAPVERPANYLWGTGDGKKPAGNAVAIARDALLVIVAKRSMIPDLPEMHNKTCTLDYPTLRRFFAAGYVKDSVQVYTLGVHAGTRRFFTGQLGAGEPAAIGKGAVEVADDWAMVEKVANDPYGIGYCSSGLFDPDRVTAIALQTPDGKVHYYPQEDRKSRWVVPATPAWPWTRTLYAVCGGAAWKADGSGIANVMLAPGGAGTAALHKGPLFGTGYWKP